MVIAATLLFILKLIGYPKPKGLNKVLLTILKHKKGHVTTLSD
jgi:hypothetical protein